MSVDSRVRNVIQSRDKVRETTEAVLLIKKTTVRQGLYTSVHCGVFSCDGPEDELPLNLGRECMTCARLQLGVLRVGIMIRTFVDDVGQHH